MFLHRIETLESYAHYLRQQPAEVQALHDDLFVMVTRFFRDPQVFHALAQVVFPRLMKDRPRGTPIRVWVSGCATGEEAYSILIALTEFLDTATGGDDVAIQMFATDLSAAAIVRARTGIFPASIENEVSADRLRRFFIRADGRYRISKAIRDACVFAHHDLARHPPSGQTRRWPRTCLWRMVER